MSNTLVRMQNVRIIIQLLQRGFSGRRISRDLGLSRNTVKLYVDRLNASEFGLEELQLINDADLSAIVYAGTQQMQPDPRRNDFSSRINYFLAELKRTGVTQQLLWEEYKKENPEGYAYSQFCELFAQHKRVNEATMHFQHKPADTMMVDFAGEPLHYVDQGTGELVSCPVLWLYYPAAVTASL